MSVIEYLNENIALIILLLLIIAAIAAIWAYMKPKDMSMHYRTKNGRFCTLEPGRTCLKGDCRKCVFSYAAYSKNQDSDKDKGV